MAKSTRFSGFAVVGGLFVTLGFIVLLFDARLAWLAWSAAALIHLAGTRFGDLSRPSVADALRARTPYVLWAPLLILGVVAWASGASPWLLGHAGIGLFGSILSVGAWGAVSRGRLLRWMPAAFLVLAVVGAGSLWLGRQAWTLEPPGMVRWTPAGTVATIEREDDPIAGAATWSLQESAGTIRFRTDVRASGGTFGNAWRVPEDRVRLEATEDGVAVQAVGDAAYVARRFEGVIQGDTLLVRLEARAASSNRGGDDPACLRLEVLTRDPSGAASRTTAPACFGPEVRAVGLEVPIGRAARDGLLSVVLADLPVGRSIELLDLNVARIGGGDAAHGAQRLGPALGTGLRFEAIWQDRNGRNLARGTLWHGTPTSEWATVDASASIPAGDSVAKLRVIAWLESGAAVDVRATEVLAFASDGRSLGPAERQARQRWTVLGRHPNAVAHGWALVAVGAAAFTAGPAHAAILLVAAAAAVVTTGSRAALLVLGLAAIPMIATRPRRGGGGDADASGRRRKAAAYLAGTAAALIGAATFAWLASGVGRDLTVDDLTQRPQAYATAWRLISGAPLVGSDVAFPEAYCRDWPDSEVCLTHAHNSFLDAGVRAGIFGLLATLWLAASLLWAVRRRVGALTAGLAIVALSLVEPSLLDPATVTVLAIVATAAVPARSSGTRGRA